MVILALIGGVVGLVVGLSGGGKPAGASEVFLQPANQAGANPFTPNVGHDAHITHAVTASVTSTTRGSSSTTTTVAPTTAQATTGIQAFTGQTVGLYGGTQNLTSCNAQQMVSYLTANPAKAQAWASAQGIPVSQLSSYILGLTPMILRYDTRVTNHGFINGTANDIPEILQAGQAVLVDSYGIPRARCFCGNPLTPPTPVESPTYTGTPWPSFQPTTIIVIQPAPVVINNFTIIDVNNGQAFGRPAGTSGHSDGPAHIPAGTPLMPDVLPHGGMSSSIQTGSSGSTGSSGNTGSTGSTGSSSSSTTVTVPVTAANGQTLGTGAVQVSLQWSSNADFDLHVFEPSGTEIYYGNRTASDGGTLDVDANGGCDNETTSPVENVYWSNPPAAGQYRAEAKLFGLCGTSPPQDFVITVKVNGRVAMQKSGSISSEDSTADFPFTLG